jgi:SAM-dependent methyltransferase
MDAPAQPARVEEALERIYANRFSPAEREARRRLWKVLCDGFFTPRYLRPTDTVVDLGAGYCDFINQIRVAQRFAVDLNPDVERFAAPGVTVIRSPLEQLADWFEPESVDLALASNVFEHLRGPDVLLGILQSVRTVLRPGGSLVIMQPNVRVVQGAFWDFFDHLLPLSERGMVEALTVAGFEIRECRARFLPYTTKSAFPSSPALLRVYLALPFVHRIFGGQMLVVGRKPAG